MFQQVNKAFRFSLDDQFTLFDIDPSNGNLIVNTELDFERQQQYVFTVSHHPVGKISEKASYGKSSL